MKNVPKSEHNFTFWKCYKCIFALAAWGISRKKCKCYNKIISRHTLQSNHILYLTHRYVRNTNIALVKVFVLFLIVQINNLSPSFYTRISRQ